MFRIGEKIISPQDEIEIVKPKIYRSVQPHVLDLK